VGLCLVPLGLLASSQSSDERAGFIAAVPLGTRLGEAVRQFAMGPNVPRTWLEACGLAVFCLGVLAGTVMAKGSRHGPRVPLVLAAIAFGAPLLVAALGIEDRFYARNVIVVVPLLAAVAAPALLRLRAAPLALYLVLAAVTSVWVATDWRYEQANWKAAIARAEAVEPGAAVVAITPLDAPVVETYLQRRSAPASGVLTKRAWIIAEPVRGPGQRALSPAPTPGLPGFSALRALEVDAFRLVLLGAAIPTSVQSGELTNGIVFAGATRG
jgi:hypothetical protein